MRHLFICIVILSTSFYTNAKSDDKPYRDPVPGGARADHHFYNKWRDMIAPAKFALLPNSETLKKDKDQVHSDDRPRYIFHMTTSKVDMKNEIWDEGYYHYAYSDKTQGDFLLQVHPKYRKCFDDLSKKFDEMQWVVFAHGEIVGRKVIRLETPRQCLGQLKDTGSKLPTATGAFNQK